MRVAALVVWILSVQLCGGACVVLMLTRVCPSRTAAVLSRRRRALLARASRGLAVTVLPCLACATAAALVVRRAGAGGPWLEPVDALAPGVFTPLGGLLTTSLFLVLYAGRLEARGAHRAALRQVAAAGRVAFVAAVTLSALVAFGLLRLPSHQRVMLLEIAPLAWFGGALLLLFAGIVALLAGLAGKPRPSGGIAAAGYVVHLAGWVHAACAAVDAGLTDL